MATGRYLEAKLRTDLVPSPAEYGVLLPPGYDEAGEPLPLCLFLHGGGGSRAALATLQPVIDGCLANGTIPPMVFATLSAGRSFYMDYRDGSQRWETFILGPYLEHLQKRYRVRSDPAGTFLWGISMGGMGGLRLALGNPERFHAVAALEPGIDPAFAYCDIPAASRFWRPRPLFEEIYGKPVDEAYWAATNPANIVVEQAQRIRDSGLAILIDAGDQDFFNLHVATEFLHRVLWDNAVPHDYHLVRWADHVGHTVRPRITDALAFLAKSMAPPEPDEQVLNLRQRLGAAKARAEGG